MKKKHSANAANAKMNMSNDSGYIARRFGGAETAGSEADESHVANSEAPAVRRKVSAITPRGEVQLFMLSFVRTAGHSLELETAATICDELTTVRTNARTYNFNIN